jgi:hypothetical protein
MHAISQPLEINQIPEMYPPPRRYVDNAVACRSLLCFEHLADAYRAATVRESVSWYFCHRLLRHPACVLERRGQSNL